MTQPIFINVDAAWLYSLGQTYIEDNDFDTGLRLCQIAERFEKLDERMMQVAKDGEFAAGIREAYARVYERSNLPPEVRTLPVKMAKTLGKNIPVKRVPPGVTASKLKADAERRTRVGGIRPEALAKLSGLKLNLSALKLKDEA